MNSSITYETTVQEVSPGAARPQDLQEHVPHDVCIIVYFTHFVTPLLSEDNRKKIQITDDSIFAPIFYLLEH